MSLKTKIKKIIVEDFKENSTIIPWTGMHDKTVNKILNLINIEDKKKYSNKK